MMKQLSSYLLQLTDIPSQSLETLLSLFKPVTIKKNSFFVKEGEVAKKIAFVESGILRAFYQNDKGEEFNKVFFTASSMVAAYSSLIKKESSKINIQCLTDSVVYEASYHEILNLYDEHQSIERVNRLMAELFFVEKEEREMSLVMNDASERYEQFKEQFQGLENEIAQYHVASYLGITPTQLSRIRAKK